MVMVLWVIEGTKRDLFHDLLSWSYVYHCVWSGRELNSVTSTFAFTSSRVFLVMFSSLNRSRRE